MQALLALSVAAAMLAGGGLAQASHLRGSKAKTQNEQKQDRLRAPHGPLHIVVSLADQQLALYDNGALVARAPVSTGTVTHPTPTGIFSIIQKNRDHQSNLYDDAPMPFMQRITWSGVALHQGRLPGRPASHGCIRLPEKFARELFGITKLGARVIVAQNDVAPAEITHPRLFAPRFDDEPIALRGTIGDMVRTADAAVTVTDVSATAVPRDTNADGLFHTSIPAVDLDTAEVPTINEPVRARAADLLQKEAERRSGPASVFVSRKDGRLYVRQNFEPVFDVDLAIDAPERPIGTHVFTAMEVKDGRVRWTVVSVPSEAAAEPGKGGRKKANLTAAQPSAAAALERLHIPRHVNARIADLVRPGFSFIVSDHGLGSETGLGTDFIVLTR
jgi:hypothetical protein